VKVIAVLFVAFVVSGCGIRSMGGPCDDGALIFWPGSKCDAPANPGYAGGFPSHVRSPWAGSYAVIQSQGTGTVFIVPMAPGQ